MTGLGAPFQALRWLSKSLILLAVLSASISTRYADAQASPPSGGFGSPPPSSSQCDASGPRLECGESNGHSASIQGILYPSLDIFLVYFVLHRYVTGNDLMYWHAIDGSSHPIQPSRCILLLHTMPLTISRGTCWLSMSDGVAFVIDWCKGLWPEQREWTLDGCSATFLQYSVHDYESAGSFCRMEGYRGLEVCQQGVLF